MAYVKNYQNQEEDKRREKAFSKARIFWIIVLLIILIAVLVLPHKQFSYKTSILGEYTYVIAVNPITNISYYLKLERNYNIDDNKKVSWYDTLENKVFISSIIVEDGEEYYYVDSYVLIPVDEEPDKNSEFSLFEIAIQSIFPQTQFKKTEVEE